MIAWACAFCASMTLAKASNPTLPIYTILGMRCFFGFCCLLPFVYRRSSHDLSHPKNPKLHFLRGVFIATSMLCTYVAYRNLPSHMAATLGSSGPLFTILLSELFLNERMGWFRWVIVGIGYAGVLCVIHPQNFSGLTGFGILLIVANVFSAATLVLARYLITQKESGVNLLFYGALYPLLIHGTLFAFLGAFPLYWMETATLLGIGFFGLLSQYCYVQALKRSPASFLAPFEYLRLCLFIPVGWFLWAEVPTLSVYIGIGLIVTASSLLSLIPFPKKKRVEPT